MFQKKGSRSISDDFDAIFRYTASYNRWPLVARSISIEQIINADIDRLDII